MLIRLFSQFRSVALILGASALLVSCDRLLTPDFNTDVAELRGGGYTLDKDHASLLFKINHLGFSTFIGAFDGFDASLDFDPENIENSTLEVIVDMSSLDINLPEFEEELLGDNWFDAAAFPQAVFRTTNYLGQDEDETFNFEGELTMHGVTAPITLNIKFNGGGRNFLTRKYTLGFEAKTSFQRSVFGVDRFTNFGVGDDIELDINVEFQQTE
jgi:polyisoprenoid-binding protein YceI